MYALVEDNNITQYINNPKSLVIGDVRYPAKIFQYWSKSELNAIGIYEIVNDLTNYKDNEYYINTNEQYNFADNQVTKSWGTATARRLNDENAVDEDGNNLLDEDGNQIINYGLKTEKKRIVKDQASGLLAPTDWYIVKSTEVADYNVPDNILSFRADVRSKSNEMETQIDACTTVDELKALYEYTEQEDGTQTRPLAEFPKEI
tara:strand:- start:671 stop:1282 length:612 start_codon:yes stop_codon:yes gene_type:complete